jgi:hypothetical protein
MKKPGASQGPSASELISKRIAELGDWRGETLRRMRNLIKEADPDVVELIAMFRCQVGRHSVKRWASCRRQECNLRR